MAEPTHRSIGEVLNLLKQEHPDITISKIRFLESQGLISPERTPSGYRKFFADDVDRLRWILEQQRDNFLPLKVIKRRLDSGDPSSSSMSKRPSDDSREPTLFSHSLDTPAEVTPSVPAPARTVAPASKPAANIGDAGSVSLTTRELADASGVDTLFVDEIQRLGLIAPIASTGESVYDHEALIVVKAAATLNLRGVRPRHLRMFKVAAERQAGVFQQLLGAKAKRNANAASAARSELNELIALGETIQRSVLRRSLGSELRNP